MPDKKISELDEAPVGTLADSDLFVVVDVSEDETKKALGSTLKDYIAGEPSLINPVVHDDVKWAWINYYDQIVGISGYANYAGGVITADVDGAIPTPAGNGDGVIPTIVPVGSDDNVLAGVQVGDRVYWGDNADAGHHGIYVVTDLGSGASPWVITRAADHQEADILTPFYVEVEDTAIVVQTSVIETDVNYLNPAISTAPGAVAVGSAALATSSYALALGANAVGSAYSALAVGRNTEATAAYAVAIGRNTQASGFASTAIGYGITNSQPYTTKIESAVIAVAQSAPDTSTGNVVLDPTISLFWELDSLTTDMTFTTANLLGGYTMTCVLFNSTDIAPAAYNLTFPVDWKFVGGAPPTSLPASKHGLLTVHSYGSTDETCYVTWHVEP